MSFDEIFDLTAGVYFHFLIYIYVFRVSMYLRERRDIVAFVISRSKQLGLEKISKPTNAVNLIQTHS